MKSFILLGIFLTSTVFAADVKIGYIDSNRILSEYRGRDVLKSELETKLKNWESEATKKKQTILDAIKNFETQGAMLTVSARDRKQEEIKSMQAEYENFVQKIYGADGEAKKLNDEVMKPFIGKVNLILQKMGEDQGFTIILDAASTGIVYTKTGMDLTDLVVQELNQEFAPITQKKEKTYFWVLKFKETTSEAIEYKAGTEIAAYISDALKGFTGFEKSDKIKQAIEKSPFNNKKEDEYTDMEAAQIGKLAEADFVVTGEVKRVGERIDITCKVIDTQTNAELAREIGSSQKAEREDIRKMIEEVASKLKSKLPGISE